MTYSIVARDPDTGELGVAVQSHYFSVGSVVTWAESGVGAVATQSFAEPAYGPRGLALMRLGVDPVDRAGGADQRGCRQGRRQVAFVDATGRVAVHTGRSASRPPVTRPPDGVSVPGEHDARRRCLACDARGVPASNGDLADRLMAALDAAEAAGGDIRGRQSAAMLIVSGTSSGQPWRERVRRPARRRLRRIRSASCAG